MKYFWSLTWTTNELETTFHGPFQVQLASGVQGLIGDHTEVLGAEWSDL